MKDQIKIIEAQYEKFNNLFQRSLRRISNN